MTATVRLQPGRESSLLRRHPWVFSGAVASVEGSPEPGETVEVRSASGDLLGLGAFSPASQIRVRLWTFASSKRAEDGGHAGDPEGPSVGPELFRARIERAVRSRLPVAPDREPAGRRLVYAESDGLPGVIVDRYGRFLVLQILSAGAERWRDEIADALRSVVASTAEVEGIWERSDADVRAKEGLAPRTGLVSGVEPPELVEIREGTCRHLVDLRAGHKTGFYLDQRRNREEVARLVAEGTLPAAPRVLNCFAYSGAFGHAVLSALAAATAGSAPGEPTAKVTHVESSADALALLRRTAEVNGFPAEAVETVEGNVFSVLRGFRAEADRDEARRFDLVILDPPKFADSRRRLEAAARGYKDINLLACQLLAPGGLLATFSCSGLLAPELFQKIVADAALDAGRDARILHHLDQADDHPVALPFPEGRYLKGLICRVW